jgi:hypothetical protein
VSTPTTFATYYAHHEGRWRGRFRLVITDPRAFREAAIPAIDRARIRMMAAICRVLGFAWMHTRVDCAALGEGRVLHETRFSRLGMPLLVGREVLTPRADGRSGTMTIDHRFPPFGARTWDDGAVIIDEHAAGAVYDLPWIGGRIRQKTRVVPDGLVVEQEGPFSHAEVCLMRLPPSA